MDELLKYSSQSYTIIYFGLIFAVSLIECFMPRSPGGPLLRKRWLGNFSIAILNITVTRYLFPFLSLGTAIWCAEHGWGLFNHVVMPRSLQFVLLTVFLDVAIYIQHCLFHQVPLLWRIHMVHHSDLGYDFTTGLRFHPLETFISTATIVIVTALVGPAPAAALLTQLVFAAQGFIEHGNLRIPAALDRLLRVFIITPDLHRIHHAREARVSNMGTVFPWWDQLMDTYVDQPAAGHERIVFGLPEFSTPKHLSLPWMLVQPFLRTRQTEEKPNRFFVPAQ